MKFMDKAFVDQAFVDQAFARRLEAAEEVPQVQFALVYQRVRPEVEAAVEAIGGGHMVFGGIGSAMGRATGLGLDGPVSAEELDRVEEFYRSRGVPVQIDICPLTDLSLVEILKQRGYAFSEFNNVLYRALRREEDFPAPPTGIEVRRARAGEAEIWARMVGRGFGEGQECTPEFLSILMPSFQIPHTIPFLAWVDGDIAAAAGGFIVPERKMVALSGDATLPDYRGRGLQTALQRARLKLAAEAGCDLAVTVTLGGTTSQRNAERMGFHLAYSKATVIKKC